MAVSLTESRLKIMFFEGLNFTKFIAPMAVGKFFSEYFGKKKLMLKRHDASFYDGLLAAEDLDEILFHWPNLTSVVKATEKNGERQNLANLYQQSTGTVLSELDTGSTLILDRLEQRLPTLTKMCGIFENELHYRFQANIYITPENSKGFKAHFDDHHVFILQIFGSKQWFVDDNAKPYGTTMAQQTDFSIDPDKHETFLLEPGDLLYIPAYTVHEAFSQDSYSIHITLSPTPPLWGDVIQTLLKKHINNSPELLEPVPHGFLNTPSAELDQMLEKLLLGLAGSGILPAMDEFKDRHIDTFRGAYSGALLNRIRRDDVIALDRRYQRNASLLLLISCDAGHVLLRVSNKRVLLPLEFYEQVVFCLSGERFYGKDIPNMDDTEREVLLKRLLVEGVLEPCQAG